MALLSLGESKWRMVRRVLRKKRFRYADARNMTRHDADHFQWLLDHGFVVALADDQFELTDKGKASAELGQYEL